jgi:hypothetical protein
MSTEQVHNDYRMKCSKVQTPYDIKGICSWHFRYMIVHFDALLKYYLSV